MIKIVLLIMLLFSIFSLSDVWGIVESDIKIKSIMINPKGRDYKEWVKLENVGKDEINLKGLIIDDIIGKGSKGFIIKSDIILLPGKDIFFKKEKTKLSFGNKLDEVNLIFKNKVIDKISWNFSVPMDYELSHFISKIIKTKVYVVKVVDGDTIIVKFKSGKEEKVRLIGINAPEIEHFKQKAEYFGKESSNFVKNKLEGKYITLEQNLEKYRGIYDRLLGYIYLDGYLFNKYLVEKGYAKAYLRYKFKYSVGFKEAEIRAKKQNVGMWYKKAKCRGEPCVYPLGKLGKITKLGTGRTITKGGSGGTQKSPASIYFKKNIKLAPPKTVVNFFILNLLLGIISILMLFLIFRKNKLI